MRLKTSQILYSINIISIILIFCITFSPENVLRIILGLPLVLFFPGYTLLAALFPRKSGLESIERFALSFGMSIAVVPLIGLGLNFTPWGIRLYPILISLLVFIIAMSIVAMLRIRRLPLDETASKQINYTKTSLRRMWSGQTMRDKIIAALLVVMIAGTIGTLVYVIKMPRTGETFTEFYVLNAEGKASDYPRTVKMGQSAAVTLGIINHESETTTYKIEIMIDGEKSEETGPIILEAEAKWEKNMVFRPSHSGASQKIEFRLYHNLKTEPGEMLHLWVDVQ
jgi:uncharacterized membrane protein